MKCPNCNSTRTIKNGHRRGKQCYQCRACGRQFVEEPKIQPYPAQVKELCLKMYLNGMGLREIERVTEIHHTTIINWIRQTGINQTGIRIKLPHSQKEKKISERKEIDELHAFWGRKINKIWIWTVVNGFKIEGKNPKILYCLPTLYRRTSYHCKFLKTIDRSIAFFFYYLQLKTI